MSEIRRPTTLLLGASVLTLSLLAGCADPPAEHGATATAPPATADRPAIERGAALYQAHCQACHGDRDGRGGRPGVPPHSSSGHTWHHPDAQLEDWILEGRSRGAMPAFGDRLTETEVEAILAFIKTWWTAEQRESQEDVSERYEEALERQRRR